MDNDRGRSLITKYVWVIETIYRKRKISFKELNELWLQDDISRGGDIPKRTFDNWRYVIWDMFGINIVNEGRGEYRYYIENEEDISKNGLLVNAGKLFFSVLSISSWGFLLTPARKYRFVEICLRSSFTFQQQRIHSVS